MLRDSGIQGEKDVHKLKRLLKRVWWGGEVIWTEEAHRELMFWLQIDFSKLSAPISYDAVGKELSAWVASPATGKLSPGVRVFAVDTSDTMSGGAEFIKEGELWRMTGAGMAVRLGPEEVLTSSTLRELLGVKRLDLALVPLTCKKLIVLLDSMAAVHCLLNGSKVTAI